MYAIENSHFCSDYDTFSQFLMKALKKLLITKKLLSTYHQSFDPNLRINFDALVIGDCDGYSNSKT